MKIEWSKYLSRKNPYDGLVLDRNNSNDGQEHEIHSFEDYQKYSRYTNKDD